MTREEIEERLFDGNTGKYSHMIVYCDRFDYSDMVHYVKYDEDVNNVIRDIQNGGSFEMFIIEEVYNYNLNLESQLNERRAYHIEPKAQKRDFSISEKLDKAIRFATEKHKGQYRKDGTPYIKHPLNVVNNVLKYKKSNNLENLLISACLHDTIEDTNTTYYDIVNEFGYEVASIVLELTTDEDLKRELGKEKYLKIKMKNMSSWALVIKLCDRLDNISDLESSNDDSFKMKYLNETIEIIKYLLENRKLSNTHVTIIEQIISNLFKLCVNDLSNIKRVETINEYCNMLKKYEEFLDNYEDGYSKKRIK